MSQSSPTMFHNTLQALPTARAMMLFPLVFLSVVINAIAVML